jgi:hypothetical protein
MPTHTRRCSQLLLDDLITSVYSQVWGEFYDSESICSQHVIDSLAAVSANPTPSYEENYQTYIPDMFEKFQTLAIDASLEDIGITVVDFDVDGSTSYSRIARETIYMQRRVPSSDVYESYTPCPRNIDIGDDSNNMLFIPHADESHFQQEEYIGFFEHISWQNDTFRDPDGSLVFSNYGLS